MVADGASFFNQHKPGSALIQMCVSYIYEGLRLKWCCLIPNET